MKMRYRYLSVLLAFVMMQHVSAQNIPNGVTAPGTATPKRTPIYAGDVSPYYQRSFVPLKPITDSTQVNMSALVDDIAITTLYGDELGRPVQAVSRQSSPNKKDVVQPYSYDAFGRVPLQYMPYASTTNTGKAKAMPFSDDSAFYKGLYPEENIYYSESVFDNSPYNEVTKSLAPGNNWGGSNRGISSTHRANTLADSVRLWTIGIVNEDDIPTTSAIYSAGSLLEQEVTDERGIKAVVYTNELGQKVLTKTQLAASPGTAHTGWLCTYYVYDETGKLRYVIPPKAVEAINNNTTNWSLSNATVRNELCYAYWYDNRGRLLMKRIPGKDKIYYAYDLWDRLVMSQDANMRSTSTWSFVKYDAQSRPSQTGTIVMSSLTAAQVQSNAAASNNYPTLTGTYTILTETYYDDYNFVTGGVPSGTIDNTNINSTNFVTTYNASPLYAQQLTQSSRIRGSVTGKKENILGTSTYLYTVNMYDDDGNAIQTKHTNITGGTDVATVQYSFSGLVLRTHISQQKSGTGAQTHTLLTKYSYDHAGRLLTLIKNIDGSGDKTTTVPVYNELGQVTAKTLGASLAVQSFNYNIRGWLTAINKDLVSTAATSPGAGGKWFGEQLSYDYGFTTPQYNGNIAGIRWRGTGDGIARAYGFTYDNANRLTAANYTQQNEGATAWTSDKMNYSVSGISYDANGNILSMKQVGLSLNAITTIDSLAYTYNTNSNKLQKIKENATYTAPSGSPSGGGLGDFQDTTLTTDDYVYDNNGNITKDNNKHIHTTANGNGITYNIFDKPDMITVNSKGTIAYTYDATGTLLQRITTDNTKGQKTVITYLGSFIYQKVMATATSPGTVPDTLQYALHEEGRIRNLVASGGTGFVYDYFLKDHLGNIRSTVTEETKTDAYPVASLETANINNEKIYYSGLDNGITLRTGITNYPTNDTYTSPNDYVQKLSAGSGGTKVGAGIFLKVMAGDKLNVQTGWWYRLAGADPANTASPLTDIVAALSAGIPGVSSNKVLQSQLTTTVLNPTATSFLTSRDANTNTARPRAWLNIMVFDEQMNLVNTNDGKNSYYQQVAGGNTANVQYMTVSQREITKSGYVYIYVSNESTDVNVYFDNLQVTQVRSALLQEQAYYPFGLEMKGISSQAAGASNNYKFNGGVEINESFDVDYYETEFRRYDCQVGRFTGVDELAEETFYLTPYQFGANDPANYNDPTGLKFTTFDKNSSSATPHIDAWDARDAHIESALGDYTLSWVTMSSAIEAGLSSTSGGGYVTADGNFVPYTQQQQAQVMNLMKTTNVRYHYANASGSALFEAPEYHGESSYTEGGWFFYTGTSNTTTFYNAMGENAAVGFKDKSSWIDNFQTGLDIAGIADPFGVADGLNTLIYLCRGDWKNAGISALGIIPYIGDVGKGARLTSKAVKAAKKGRVFWSGGEDAMNAAMSYAKANGMTTLEMTRAGQNLTKLTQGMPWEQAGPMWQRLSAAYAKGATGPVHVFQNATTGVRLSSVWKTVEYPILNGKNNIIFHNVFKP